MPRNEQQDWVKEHFGSQYRLADELGWQRSKVSKLLTGKQEWTEDDILAVAALTASSPVTLSRLFRGREMLDNEYSYSYIRSWGPEVGNRNPDPKTWVDKAEWRFPAFFMESMGMIEDISDEAYKIWWVRGHSNAPRYCEGDFLIVNTGLKSLQGTGDYLIDMGGHADSRGIESYMDEEGIWRWCLTCYNPDYPDRVVKPESFEILGGIVGQIRPV